MRGLRDALLKTVEAISALDRPTAEKVEAGLPTGIAFARIDVRKGFVVLDLPDDVDRTGLAVAVTKLGDPIALNIVSPPIAGDGRPPWDVKRSLVHEIAGRRVSFGIEVTEGVKRLVSISIRFDGPPAEHLPPEKREGPFSLTVSLGWCGGHGEAVLDAEQSIRYHDDLPIFVDAKSHEEVLGRVDLRGTWQGTPVVRLAGRGRLERRESRNASIPGAPKQRYIALVITTLDEARVEGERPSED